MDATSELRVKKYQRRMRQQNSGITYSFNEWEVRRGVKLVKRFDRRCDAYAFLRTARAAQATGG